MTREYLVLHPASGHWSTITFDTHETYAQVYANDTVSVTSFDTGRSLLDFCRASTEYTVEEQTQTIGGY